MPIFLNNDIKTEDNNLRQLRNNLYFIKPTVYYCIHQQLPSVPVISHTNQVDTLQFYFNKIYFKIILPPTFMYFKWSPSSTFFHQTPACTFVMPCPPHPHWFDHPNVWCEVLMRILSSNYLIYPPNIQSKYSWTISLKQQNFNTQELSSSLLHYLVQHVLNNVLENSAVTKFSVPSTLKTAAATCCKMPVSTTWYHTQKTEINIAVKMWKLMKEGLI